MKYGKTDFGTLQFDYQLSYAGMMSIHQFSSLAEGGSENFYAAV